MRVSKHNGRSGKNGVYNPKHNDRRFNPDHSDHINKTMMLQNIYWDCYNGMRTQEESVELEYPSFEEIETRYYEEQYSDFVREQNYRNEWNGHKERNRSVMDLYQSKKTCPEESIYQIGNIDESVDSQVLLKVTKEFFEKMNELYGEHVHIIDWALHVDESTPHIHERHVFDAKNRYGELAPQQDKALEMMGIGLPKPDKPKGKHNNRKMEFDACLREIFLDICEKNGLKVERKPVYGNREYLEKQDYIINNQLIRLETANKRLKETKGELAEVKVELDAKSEELDGMNKNMRAVNIIFDNLAEAAYDTVCNLVTERAVDVAIGRNQFHADRGFEKACDSTYLSGYEQSKFKTIINKVFDYIKEKTADVLALVKVFLEDSYYKKCNVETVKEGMLNKLETLTSNKSVDEIDEVNEQVQEMAQQMIRRGGRGR